MKFSCENLTRWSQNCTFSVGYFNNLKRASCRPIYRRRAMSARHGQTFYATKNGHATIAVREQYCLMNGL